MSRLFDLFKVLAPPLGDSAEEILRWRWVMASSVYGLIIAFVIHLAWVGGGLQWAGIDGVASAGEVGDLTKAFYASEQVRLESDIFNTRRRLCNSAGALRDSYAEQLAKLIAQWRELSDEDTGPVILDCADLGGTGE